MTLDGFITFLGLIAAALAIVPPVTRLQFEMGARRIAIWSTLFTIAVLYFEFFDLLAPACPKRLASACITLSVKGPVTPQQAAFVVVFVWLILLARTLLRPKLGMSALPDLDRLLNRLAEAGRYAELVELVEPRIAFIDVCASGTLPSQRRKARLAGRTLSQPLSTDDVLSADEARPAARTWRATSGRRLSALVPDDAKARTAAESILQTVLRSAPIVDWIAERRPHFGARLLSLGSYKVNDFVDQYLGWLIAHPTSAIYDEIRANQNLARCGYRIEEHNPVLRALFDDPKVAERLEIYQPVGEQMVAALSPANSPDYRDALNLAADRDWDERGCWRDPTFVGIRFFDIMVQASACHGITWHMWLFYLKDVVAGLEALYDDRTGEEFVEFPTRAARNLYAAFDALSDWVRIATKVGDASPHRAPQDGEVHHDNGNIPKSAALAIGICLRTVLCSERISPRVRGSLLGIAIAPLHDPLMRVGHDNLRRVLIGAIVQGGLMDAGPVYLERLRHAFARTDRLYLDAIEDFRVALKAAG